ncbi:MAG: 3-dehydroquinate synthase, partial [Chloroflexi bacterium]|nr:3-dehydroquinate synthase [Chloroflexota bacterium]
MQKLEPRLRVTAPNGSYGIYVGAELLNYVGDIVASLGGKFSRRCAIVTNPTVGARYAARVVDALARKNFEARVIEIPDGEKFKTLETMRAVYDQLIDARIDRGSIIFALGGGVIGDVAGFCAATILRGVPFIQISTTLLAMVDASIGGKVGVDHPRGKNLIGAFYPPRAIIADIATLNTLPEVEWRCGMAEVVKHAIVGDAKLFDWLEERRWTKDDGRWTVDERRWTIDDGRWIERALRVKVEIVARDPFERGERMKLNLGHTFAHALEIVSDFQLRHGEAVGIGLVCATRFAVLQKISDASLVERVEQLL